MGEPPDLGRGVEGGPSPELDLAASPPPDRSVLPRWRYLTPHLIDLNLIADRQYARELFTALRPLPIQWYGLATTLLDLAAESGCRGLLMGLESISPRNLLAPRKGCSGPERFAQVIERLHERGIALQCCFVFGLDEDDPEVFQQTARFAMDTGIDLPRFAIITPFPGTSLFARLEAEEG